MSFVSDFVCVLEKINFMNKKLINYLSEFVTEHKIEIFDRIIESRTKHLTVVLEDIYQPHNASAVLRTADCFGIQDVHVIENSNILSSYCL